MIDEHKNLASERPADATCFHDDLDRYREAVAAQMTTPDPEYRDANSESR